MFLSFFPEHVEKVNKYWENHVSYHHMTFLKNKKLLSKQKSDPVTYSLKELHWSPKT
jgi:hypothetical protein